MFTIYLFLFNQTELGLIYLIFKFSGFLLVLCYCSYIPCTIEQRNKTFFRPWFMIDWFAMLKKFHKFSHVGNFFSRKIPPHSIYILFLERNKKLWIFLVYDLQTSSPQKWPYWVFDPKSCDMFWNEWKKQFSEF